jgi:hypothetical protein
MKRGTCLALAMLACAGVCLLWPAANARAGCCGGSVVVELVAQQCQQVTVLLGPMETEVKVCQLDPTPVTQYDYYICFCNRPHQGTDCCWSHKTSLYEQRPDVTDPGCGWLSGDHREASSCDILGETCNP